ncbi:hypothetical protein DFP93_101229 [Aneurinibacillus soli]|uniref:Uncharacterized protein n=2 Tax=Aneurinibacillus soli TaxID=1500254 RepID=A0A0U4WHS1_9BACL|nr:hypothetical protein DFP93_101229 [Aneurinibacillus soli]BAU28153.1 hypothetical protein CB4_02327 [Aneurinibacillus soli]
MAAKKQSDADEKVVHVQRVTLRISEYGRIYSYGHKVIVTNTGGGDAYVGMDNQNVPSSETLLPVGETREFDDTVNAFAYSCPTLEVKLVEK